MNGEITRLPCGLLIREWDESNCDEKEYWVQRDSKVKEYVAQGHSYREAKRLYLAYEKAQKVKDRKRRKDDCCLSRCLDKGMGDEVDADAISFIERCYKIRKDGKVPKFASFARVIYEGETDVCESKSVKPDIHLTPTAEQRRYLGIGLEGEE